MYHKCHQKLLLLAKIESETWKRQIEENARESRDEMEDDTNRADRRIRSRRGIVSGRGARCRETSKDNGTR